ncbi:HESP123 [Hemileuca sp. nucleopolyhedrovirus]|uniref:HESP123 n=1 Tax=Hemileuca sp. nucleopolyhedrovirus TaxID=1367203 RepID=S5N3C7_9ABAC|nr:HESP123 [Hemileuca sp. nucleopolyhedrovirus]AGR56875.1 HESP123 [Hemileuca sp. nucleopolyhedrovirus]
MLNNNVYLNENVTWGKCVRDLYAVCFLVSNKHKSYVVMLLLRTFGLLVSMVMFGAAYYIARDRFDFFIYYSHWVLLLLIFMFTTGMITSAIMYSKRHVYKTISSGDVDDAGFHRNNHNKYNYGSLPWYMKLQALIFNVTISSNVVVTIIYLVTMLIDPQSRRTDNAGFIVNTTVHVTNSILVLCELVLSAIPIRLESILHPIMFNILYGIFYLVYQHYTTKTIYYPISIKEAIMYSIIINATCVAVYLVTYIIGFIKYKCNKEREIINNNDVITELINN